jgi:hypothetical protein
LTYTVLSVFNVFDDDFLTSVFFESNVLFERDSENEIDLTLTTSFLLSFFEKLCEEHANLRVRASKMILNRENKNDFDSIVIIFESKIV